ncbi:glycosyltransferase [Empedobacter falsenii]
MRDSPLVSIIIPVYNAEKYIDRVLKSIHSQIYTNFEVIIVDDGSTDNSYKIIEKWLSIDSRFKYFFKDNAGVSAARNLGINYSKGEYIVFVDADDETTDDYIIDFIKNIENEDTLIIQDINRFIHSIIINNYLKLKLEKIKLANIHFKGKFFVGYPFNKFFNAKIIKTNNLKFDETLRIREDEAFFFEYLEYIEYIKTIDKANYIYISTGENSSEKDFHFTEYLKILINFNNFISSGIIIQDTNNKELSTNYTLCFNQLMKSLNGFSKKERVVFLKNNYKVIKFPFINQKIKRFDFFVILYKLRLYKMFDYFWFNNF